MRKSGGTFGGKQRHFYHEGTKKEEENPKIPDKQAITGDYYGNCYDNLPALQVGQAKIGCFEAIYEDNA